MAVPFRLFDLRVVGETAQIVPQHEVELSFKARTLLHRDTVITRDSIRFDEQYHIHVQDTGLTLTKIDPNRVNAWIDCPVGSDFHSFMVALDQHARTIVAALAPEYTYIPCVRGSKITIGLRFGTKAVVGPIPGFKMSIIKITLSTTGKCYLYLLFDSIDLFEALVPSYG
jgi:hypothetical protein